ncbi:MAG TPA: type I-U CRISPR-associated protein Csb2 [Myxococcota bacterium]|nr:type I-U CRISPR-associated protein Csb2 [Myxococcota bacterium]
MFALGIHYLTGRSASASYRDRKVAEWPPHPARLFSAMVATCFERGGDTEERAVLRWLAALGPPAMTVPAADRRSVLDSYVPTNDAYKSPELRVLQARHFPSVTPQQDHVSLIWPDAALPLELQAAMGRLLPEVARLGHSSSLVRVEQLESPPEPNLIPDPLGTEEVRVPYAGLLEELEVLFKADRKPGPGLVLRYRYTERQNLPCPTDFSELYVYRIRRDWERDSTNQIPAGNSLLGIQSLALTDAVRGTLLAQLNGQQIPAGIHGHEGEHIAILALPWVDYPGPNAHADGTIKGVGFAIPRNMEEDQREELVMALGRARLHRTKIRLGRLGVFALEPVEEDDSIRSLAADTWTGASRRWATVTPLIFGHYPKKGVEASVRKMCALLDLPEVEAVEVRPEAYWAGVDPAWKFRMIRPEEDDSRRLRFHVLVEFAEPVRGPLVLGKHRHFGMGLFRPMGGA